MSGSRIVDMPGRRRRRHARGQGMVEFALIGPLAFLFLLSMIVLGVIVLHEIQLTQAVRDSARAAAICGSQTNVTVTPPTLTPQLPSGTACTTANIRTYINTRVTAVDPGLADQATMTVYCDGSVKVGGVVVCANGVSAGSGSGATAGAAASNCVKGYTVEVSITYQQPLYLPLVGNVFGNSGGNTRTLSAKGEATCER